MKKIRMKHSRRLKLSSLVLDCFISMTFMFHVDRPLHENHSFPDSNVLFIPFLFTLLSRSKISTKTHGTQTPCDPFLRPASFGLLSPALPYVPPWARQRRLTFGRGHVGLSAKVFQRDALCWSWGRLRCIFWMRHRSWSGTRCRLDVFVSNGERELATARHHPGSRLRF